jgi:RNA polymerase sigma-70 factor (ECF subfamily)
MMDLPLALTTTAAEADRGQSFEQIFGEHSPYVCRVLRHLGVASRDLEDVAQEVFLVLHRRLVDFEGRGTLRSFIYGICLRVASDHRRRASVRREIPSDAPPSPSVPPPQLAATESREARARLASLLAQLDEAKLHVFVLYELEELSMREVAHAVGCTVPTAYARLAAARRKLRAIIRRTELAKEAP